MSECLIRIYFSRETNYFYHILPTYCYHLLRFTATANWSVINTLALFRVFGNIIENFESLMAGGGDERIYATGYIVVTVIDKIVISNKLR
jgi:hypothetical protein